MGARGGKRAVGLARFKPLRDVPRGPPRLLTKGPLPPRRQGAPEGSPGALSPCACVPAGSPPPPPHPAGAGGVLARGSERRAAAGQHGGSRRWGKRQRGSGEPRGAGGAPRGGGATGGDGWG